MTLTTSRANTRDDPRDNDIAESLAAAVTEAFENSAPLAIRGSGTKAFLGESGSAEQSLDITGHRGVVSYEPGELVITARAGTPLADIERTLADSGQALAFEPPYFGDAATLGGTIATNLAGPARPFTGAARDFVLGARIINGRGEILRFGGEVMKNVAGYDLSRLMAGAFGTLGVLLDVSLKVLPRPRAQVTQRFEQDQTAAIQNFCQLGRKPWPITASYWEDGTTYLRLAGAASSVSAAQKSLGGEMLSDDVAFWRDVREQQRPLFTDAKSLWRLSVAPATPVLDIAGTTAMDWGGALRWLAGNDDEQGIRQRISQHGGHATVYRGQASSRLHPLSHPMMAVHTRLKNALDPAGILNPGRMYADF